MDDSLSPIFCLDSALKHLDWILGWYASSSLLCKSVQPSTLTYILLDLQTMDTFFLDLQVADFLILLSLAFRFSTLSYGSILSWIPVISTHSIMIWGHWYNGLIGYHLSLFLLTNTCIQKCVRVSFHLTTVLTFWAWAAKKKSWKQFVFLITMPWILIFFVFPTSVQFGMLT